MSQVEQSSPTNTGRPSVCRNCGAIVGAGEAICGQCGAPLIGAVVLPRRPVRDAEAMRFARAILTRPATFTIILLVANVFVFLLMQNSGGTENHETLRLYGAKFNSLIEAGEWWRFVTPVFIHIGWIHLLANMYGLFILGPYVEKLYGSAKFVVFWIVAGIAGVAASYVASKYGMQEGLLGRFLARGGDGPSAGASGALFGLIGVLFVFGIKFRHELPEGFKQAFGTGMLPTILINLFIGYALPFIDNAAHLGGLLAGAVMALFVGYKRPGERPSIAHLWHALQILALLLVVVSFSLVARNYTGAPPALLENVGDAASRILRGNQEDVRSYIDAANTGQKAFAQAINGDASEAEAAIEKLEGAPRLDDEAGALNDQLKELILRARDLAVAEKPTNNREQRARVQQLNGILDDFNQWQARRLEWTKANGERYGIIIQEPPSPREANEPQS
ncbi:MAG: rhomboid family intramembrane serine protease [Pyrinomonadaceae bacterium]|nr:rhomboid family intramembrane serine protease [Pyrinomonadaceae bacterium]